MERVLMYLPTFLYLLLVRVSGGARQLDVQPWRQIPAIGGLCPGQKVCPEFLAGNHSENSSLTDNSGSGCCSECSCDPSCASLDNCCFPEMGPIRDRSDQECLHAELLPLTTRRARFTKSFYMTTKMPKSGCVSSFKLQPADKGTASCCERDVTPWGSLHPVWSPSERKIFKNRLYAACYGISDVIDWKVFLICKEVKDLSSDLEGCNVVFSHQGRPDEVSTEQCFTDLYSECPSDFHIQHNYQFLTKEDIRRGCNSSLHSPYNNIFSAKNVFCYMCMYSPRDVTPNHCSEIDVDRSFFSEHRYVSVIDYNYLKRYTPNTKGTNKACRIENGTIVENSCRTLLCPNVQVFSAPGGECMLASRNWRLGIFFFIIKLRIEDGTDDLLYSTLHNEWVSIMSRNLISKWKLIKAFIPFIKNFSDIPNGVYNVYTEQIFNQSMYGDPAKELYLEFEHKHLSDDPYKFLSQINESTKKKWSLSISNIKYTASAELISHSVDLHGFIGNLWKTYLFSFVLAESNNDTRLFNQSMILLQLTKMRFLTSTPASEMVSKMYFCRQVRLNANEFVVFNKQDPLALLLLMTNRYIYDSEFKLESNIDGTLSARVCLEDSGYSVISSTSSAAPLNLHKVFTVLNVILILLSSESAWCQR